MGTLVKDLKGRTQIQMEKTLLNLEFRNIIWPYRESQIVKGAGIMRSEKVAHKGTATKAMRSRENQKIFWKLKMIGNSLHLENEGEWGDKTHRFPSSLVGWTKVLFSKTGSSGREVIWEKGWYLHMGRVEFNKAGRYLSRDESKILQGVQYD